MAQREYDVFISFKESGEDKSKTEDYFIAKRLYEFLTEKGLAVFFSPVTLESLGKAQYSKMIDEALDTVEVLIAVGCSKQHLKTRWVEYEWGSFIEDIRSGAKPNAEVFVVFSDMDISEFPRALKRQQAFDAKDSSSFERLFGFLRNNEAILEKIKTKTSTEPQMSDRPTSEAMGKYNEYRVASLEELLEIGIDAQIVEDVTRKLDFEDYKNLTEEDEGTPDQWVEIWNNHPEFWRALLYKDEIVGYFLFVFVTKEDLEEIKKGSISDSDITNDRVINVSDFECQFGGNYLYFMDVVIQKEHRLRGAKMLFDAYINQLIYFAENGIYIEELCAIGYTKQGDALCRKIGMNFACSHAELNELYNVYNLELIPFPMDSYLTKKYPELRELYDGIEID